MAKPAIHRPRPEPMEDVEWQVSQADHSNVYHIITKDIHHRRVGRSYSRKMARQIVKDHNTALTQREAGATCE